MNDLYLAVVIGRNRRVYARVYKRPGKRIAKMAEHYFASEMRKSRSEGFRATGMEDISPSDHIRVFKVKYNAITVSRLLEEEVVA